MKRFLPLLIPLLINPVFPLSSFSQTSTTEEIFTLETYYPAPFGVYKELRLFPNTSPSSCNANNEGTMYYDNSPGENRLKVCRETSPLNYQWQSAGDAAPPGAAMFFNAATCPAGWSELNSARGRYIVGLNSGGTPGGTMGTALSNLENRPVGEHTHSINDPRHNHMTWGPFTGSYPANNAAGPIRGPYSPTSMATTGITINTAGSVPDTNAPYIQLLVCVKD